MILYKYTVALVGTEYKFDIGEVDTDVSPEAADLATHFTFDQPIRIDFPDTNQISYLFNDKLALMSFCEGLRFSHDMVSAFDNMKNSLEKDISIEDGAEIVKNIIGDSR